MIGDVVGHGVRAATTMSELRNALRAFAVEGHSPGAALQQLDRVVHATFGPGMIATVLFLIIDAAKGTVTISRAPGTRRPRCATVGGEIRFLETGRHAAAGDRRPRQAPTRPSTRFDPGDTLLLFTDGLVERRRESINTGFDRLRDAFASAPADVEELCDYVLERTVTEQASHDDIAVLAVRVLGPPLGALQLTLPAKAASVPLVRHRLRVWLNENVPELDADGSLRPRGRVVGGVHERDPPRIWPGRCDVRRPARPRRRLPSRSRSATPASGAPPRGRTAVVASR